MEQSKPTKQAKQTKQQTTQQTGIPAKALGEGAVKALVWCERCARSCVRWVGAKVRRLGHLLNPKSSAKGRDVYVVRRIVAILVSLVVAIALIVGIYAVFASNRASSDDPVIGSNSATTQGHASKRKVQGDKPAGKSDNGKPGKDSKEKKRQSDALKQRYKITPQPALTDQSRADILAKAQDTADQSGQPRQDFSYCVAARGNVGNQAALELFENDAFRTLNDPRGWPRAGATFSYSADSSNCEFTLNLTQSDQVSSFSSDCSNEYSCRVGDDVVINADRWNGGTESWIGAGGTMDRYRIMAINHEVGHWLGHIDNEPSCPAAGQPAPLMQEQSMGLKGCTPNEWPTDAELWISR